MRVQSHEPAPLWPREHGATVQVILALALGLFLARGHILAWGQALSTLALFLSSSGIRAAGPRPRRLQA